MQLEDLKCFPDELHGELFGQQRVDLTGRQPNDFDIQIPRLSTEREITDAAPDQPDPSSPATNGEFNPAQDVPEVGIFKTEMGRHLDHRVAEELRSFFRRHRVDVETGTPFEAGDLRQFGNDLQVPMVVVAGLLMKG